MNLRPAPVLVGARRPQGRCGLSAFVRPLAFVLVGLQSLASVAANIHGRVEQLEIELRKELQSQLKDKLQVALNSSSLHLIDGFNGSSGEKLSADILDASQGNQLESDGKDSGVVLRTSLIAAPRQGWQLVADSEREAASATITTEAPLCLVTPLSKRSNLEKANAVDDDSISAHHVVASRLLHAGRMIRLARDFVVGKLKLPGSSHRRRPRDPDLRPAYVSVVAPDELADVVCKVVEDEFWEWTLRASCSKFSAMARAVISSSKKSCSYGMWGTSAEQGENGRAVLSSLFSFQAGIELDLDAGDSVPPPVFPQSWIPEYYGTFTDPLNGIADEKKKGSKGPFTIVSAFSKNHYTVGLRLMNSILVYGTKSTVPYSVVIYTMETFSSEAREQVLCVAEQIKQAGLPIVVRAFDFNRYPHWMYIRHYKAGWWAWKAVMVWETFVQRRGSVLWLDAGDYISGPEALPVTLAALEARSFVGITREWFGMNYRWTHPSTITFLGADVSSTTTQCCGCLFGVTERTYKSIVRPMFECSLTLQCIAPEGSTMGNHRQDQSVLSVLAWHHGYECAGPHDDLLWKCDGGRNHCSEPAKGGAADLCQLK